MKTIQITIDERLLAALDANEEVQRDGRSAVLRRAAKEYLRRQQSESIAAQYQAAYGDADEAREELSGWDEEGEWPPE